MKIDSAACTHIGTRTSNQDAYALEPSFGLYVVADGMGGYSGGDIASRLVTESLAHVAASLPESPAAADAAEALLLGARRANAAIHAQQVGELQRMGSTVAAVIVCGDAVVTGHAGDSRIYRLRSGVLERLTRDHSLYQELLASGAKDLPPEREFPMANVITRALGLGGEPELGQVEIESGDTLLLCSDGLTGALTDEAIAALLAQPVVDAARDLVQAAVDADGSDNITVVVLRCEAG